MSCSTDYDRATTKVEVRDTRVFPAECGDLHQRLHEESYLLSSGRELDQEGCLPKVGHFGVGSLTDSSLKNFDKRAST